jgi:hypothetical protein
MAEGVRKREYGSRKARCASVDGYVQVADAGVFDIDKEFISLLDVCSRSTLNSSCDEVLSVRGKNVWK